MNLIAAIRGVLPVDSSGLVVAVSGGADSVALLRAVCELAGSAPVIAAHLNHRLRGPESDADEQFVRELSHQLGVPLVVGQAGAIAGNLEAGARRHRYRFLVNVARKHSATVIATGHTANDQAETILHRLIRGSGLRGLRGIARHRPIAAGISVVRPMLDTTRGQVLDYLREVGQSFRDDSSNTDTRLMRNRIRHELVPLLESNFNPAAVPLLTRLAAQAAETFADVRRRARKLLRQCERPAAGEWRIIDVETLLAAPRYLQRETLRLLWRRERWPVDRMGYVEWERLVEVAAGQHSAVDLPGRLHVRRRGRVLQIGRIRSA